VVISDAAGDEREQAPELVGAELEDPVSCPADEVARDLVPRSAGGQPLETLREDVGVCLDQIRAGEIIRSGGAPKTGGAARRRAGGRAENSPTRCRPVTGWRPDSSDPSSTPPGRGRCDSD